MIEQYDFGKMTVGGRSYTNDLKIIDGRIIGDWWRKAGHRCEPEDMGDILAAKPTVVVIGTGYSGNMRVSNALVGALKERRIRMIAEPTGKAKDTFNRLAGKDRQIAGAFHLTC